MTDDRDFDILHLVRRGDSSSMEELYLRHIGYLTSACSRYVTDADALHDVLQTSFEKIFSSIGRFSYRGPGSLRAWMTRIAVNEALKYLRGRAKEDMAMTGDIPDIVTAPYWGGDGGETAVIKKAATEGRLAAIEDLLPNYPNISEHIGFPVP